MSQFLNKRALVTGAAGGIGQAIVARLRAEGAVVAAADIATDGINADIVLPGDLSDAGYCEALCQDAHDALNGLDILVNNAGIITRGKVTDATDDDFQRSLAINVEAPFRLSRAAVPIMADAGGGVIVNTASCWGLRPGPDHAIYCMTKAALASLTQCMGRDHAHQHIRVNAVCPNEVDTPMLRSGFIARGLDPDTAVSELDKSVPLGRIAQASDIADIVCFLASDDARYLCGSLIEVNGGKPVG